MSAIEKDYNKERKRNKTDSESSVHNHPIGQISTRKKSNRMYGRMSVSYLGASSRFKPVSDKEECIDPIEFESGLEGETPRVGMAIEICDPDNIWSSASIVKVDIDRKKLPTNVTIRYDGWGPEWDEVLPWHNCQRLAKILTLTKRFKCMVDLKNFTPSLKVTCTLWPCIVHFRMPNPYAASPNIKKAENFLRTEPNIFVQPYGWDTGLLPDCVPLLKSMSNNIEGMWMHSSRVKRWRDDLKEKNKPPVLENFAKAYKIGLKDQSVPNTLPSRAFDKGSLLNAQYRVKLPNVSHYNKSSALETDDVSSVVETDSDTVFSYEESAASYARKRLTPESAPILTGSVNILGNIYSGENIKRVERSGEICATVAMGGNDFVIGTYATQYQAEAATQAALQINGGNMERNMKKFRGTEEDLNAKILEMEDVSLEAIVASFHKVSKSKPNFSIHDWACKQLNFKEYLRRELSVNTNAMQKRDNVEHNFSKGVGREISHRKRKRTTPRRVRHGKYEMS